MARASYTILPLKMVLSPAKLKVKPRLVTWVLNICKSERFRDAKKPQSAAVLMQKIVLRDRMKQSGTGGG